MDKTAANEILDYLKGVAATLVAKESGELREMKSGLDAYVQAVTSKMPGAAKASACNEFEKCRMCAGDWIKVYLDPTFDPDSKADILREEAVEFFFTTDERVRAVQKKFFLLGMIDELLQPGRPFTVSEREAKIAYARIRILAAEKGLKARCSTHPEAGAGKAEARRLWYFGDERNYLQSDDAGLTDEEAIAYLQP